jgi:hypothetical protein
VKFLILIYSNPQSRQIWEGFTDEERAQGLDMYDAISADLEASGERIVSERLGDPALAKRVWLRDGQITTTDAPLAETKEHLAGFFLVDCETAERAIEIAGGLPEAFLGLIEVRPVMDLRGPEW